MAFDLYRAVTGGRAHTGSWSVPGTFGLVKTPDLGLTERAPQQVQNRIGAPISQPQPYNPPPPDIIKDISINDKSGPQLPYNPMPQVQQQQQQQNQQLYNQGVQNVQGQGNEALNLINQDYEAAMGYLGSQEQTVRSDAATAQQAVDLTGSRLRTTLGEETTTREGAAQDYLSTGEKEYGNAMQQARDLFRQQQQTNIAQLSALGISSSSVSEALAEKLGVETARRLSGYTGSIAELRTNVQKEIGNIKSYAARRNSEIEEDLKIQKQQITSQLSSALNQLNYQRGQSAVEKARGRKGILDQVQNQTYELTKQAQLYRQDLERWEKTQTQKVYGAITNLPDQLASTVNILREKPEFTGLDWTPSINWNQSGNMTGQITGRVPANKGVYRDPITGQLLDENGNPV